MLMKGRIDIMNTCDVNKPVTVPPSSYWAELGSLSSSGTTLLLPCSMARVAASRPELSFTLRTLPLRNTASTTCHKLVEKPRLFSKESNVFKSMKYF